MDTNINFPNLHIELEGVGKTISIFGFEIAYYGIIIAIGMVVGVLLALKEAKRTGQNQENYYDLAIYAILFAMIGARLYYVAFSWDMYKDDLLSIFNIREGGLAIYGGIIAAVAATFVFSKVKRLSFLQLVDTACIGLVSGQIIGRWGNFFNREAFGGYTDGLFAMQIPMNAVRNGDLTAEIAANIQTIGGIDYIQVHPTFLYESLWNLGVLIIILIYRKHKIFQGELFLVYLLGYGIGRSWIEGLRTDQLLALHGTIPVSQALAIALIVVSIITICVGRYYTRKTKIQGD